MSSPPSLFLGFFTANRTWKMSAHLPVLMQPNRFDRKAHALPPKPPKFEPLSFPFLVDALPRLPAITDPACAKAVVSILTAETPHVMELALEGDALLGLEAYLAIKRVATERHSGDTAYISTIRALLVRNNTFSYLALAYRLHLRMSISFGLSQKRYADAFEAYIGALHRQAHTAKQQATLKEWFAEFFSPSVWPGLEQLSRGMKLQYSEGEKEQKKRKDEEKLEREGMKRQRLDDEIARRREEEEGIAGSSDSDIVMLDEQETELLRKKKDEEEPTMTAEEKAAVQLQNEQAKLRKAAKLEEQLRRLEEMKKEKKAMMEEERKALERKRLAKESRIEETRQLQERQKAETAAKKEKKRLKLEQAEKEKKAMEGEKRVEPEVENKEQTSKEDAERIKVAEAKNLKKKEKERKKEAARKVQEELVRMLTEDKAVEEKKQSVEEGAMSVNSTVKGGVAMVNEGETVEISEGNTTDAGARENQSVPLRLKDDGKKVVAVHGDGKAEKKEEGMEKPESSEVEEKTQSKAVSDTAASDDSDREGSIEIVEVPLKPSRMNLEDDGYVLLNRPAPKSNLEPDFPMIRIEG
ncbi:hypothetical protein P7C73_g5272, partial [Tremellales sp. Uapishka_1]